MREQMPAFAGFSLRPLVPEDAAQAAALFHDAVHRGCRRFYSDAALRAWSPKRPDEAEAAQWQMRFAGLDAWAAEGRLIEERAAGSASAPRLLGFADMTRDGYLDHLFVLPEAERRGIGRALAETLEARAAARGVKRLTVRASLAARPFFEALGWRVVRRLALKRSGETLVCFRMAKRISCAPERRSLGRTQEEAGAFSDDKAPAGAEPNGRLA